MSADVEGALVAHLGAVAPRWCPDLGPPPVEVRVLRRRHHASSRTWLVELGGRRRVVVKVPERARPVAVRPRVVPLPDFLAKHDQEVRALEAARRHFEAAGDPRFGTVRVLDHLPWLRAVVLEEVPHPTLAARFRQAAARCVRPVTLTTAFANAGAWLRRYHELAPDAAARPRQARPDEVAATVERLADHLLAAGAGNGALSRARAAAPLVVERLPGRLPVALAHGDFGLPNVFVGPGDRVTGYDMTGAWTAPPVADVAYLLTSMEADGALLAAGRAGGLLLPVGSYRAAFLAGYFGAEPVPAAPLAAFRLLALLDRWAALAARQDRLARARVLAARARLSALVHREIDVLDGA